MCDGFTGALAAQGCEVLVRHLCDTRAILVQHPCDTHAVVCRAAGRAGASGSAVTAEVEAESRESFPF